MFHERVGDLFTDPGMMIPIITTNSVVNKGRLVMGAGIALAARQRYPEIDALAGTRINDLGTSTYNLLWIDKYGVLLLQTKRAWKDPSPIDLVEESIKRLRVFADTMVFNDVYEYRLPQPGCGLGGLSWENQVRPICQKYLDERFCVYNKV